MKILKIIGIIILILIAIIVVLGIVAPKNYHVERSIVIEAPKELVFNYVKYWRNWQTWSYWAEMDSTMQVTVEGVDGAVNAKYKWVGDKAGTGEMITTGIKENEEVVYHLHFIKPWESESDGYVRLADVNGKTETTWAFYGKNSFPWNIMSLFMSMDKMVGKDFEQGLHLLKEICEKDAATMEAEPVTEE